MKIQFHQILQILLALFCLVFGANKFLHFLPGPVFEGDAKLLMDIYTNSGFLKLIGGLEIIAGLSLLVNKYVPLTLIILIAIFSNAVIFHLLHDFDGIAAAIIALFLTALLLNRYKPRFLSIMSP